MLAFHRSLCSLLARSRVPRPSMYPLAPLGLFLIRCVSCSLTKETRAEHTNARDVSRRLGTCQGDCGFNARPRPPEPMARFVYLRDLMDRLSGLHRASRTAACFSRCCASLCPLATIFPATGSGLASRRTGCHDAGMRTLRLRGRQPTALLSASGSLGSTATVSLLRQLCFIRTRCWRRRACLRRAPPSSGA